MSDSSDQSEINMMFSGEVYGAAGNVEGDQVVNARPNLANSANEIQQLLQQLGCQPGLLPEKVRADVNLAVEAIQKDPRLMKRVLGALKSGGIEALKELTDCLHVKVLLSAYDGWQNPK